MKYKLLVTLIAVMLIVSAGQVFAQDGGGDLGLPLCLPGMPADGTCLLYGPAQTVAEMEAEGFPYPAREIPAASRSTFRMTNAPRSTVHLMMRSQGSIRSAILNPVHSAISAISTGRIITVSLIYRLRPEPGCERHPRLIPISRACYSTIIDRTPSYTEPSFSAQTSGKEYFQTDLIQVYKTVEAEQVFWYEIAPNEWVNSLKARVVTFNPERPEGVESDRWIEVNLFQQTLSVYEDGNLIFATLIASGFEPFYTRPGVFQIYEKKPLETMRGAFEADRSDYYYLEDVPWTMYYDEARALHATYWHTLFGYRQSHGCVNLSPGDANWLYQWANIGDTVWVHDPSGMTPEDPNYYGPGAP